MNWMELTLHDFQVALASSSPTPGGGTAAAVALGQAASLAIMVSDLTMNSEKWKEGWPMAEKIQMISIPLLHRSGQLAQEDSEAFDRVMDAYRLPKTNDIEMSQRKMAIHSAMLHAALIPLQTAEAAYSLLSLLPALATTGNANAVSDVGVAGLLASAAGKGALLNVETNLRSLPDEITTEIQVKLPALKEGLKSTSREVMHAVRARLDA